MSDGLQHTTSYAYDAFSRLRSVTPPNVGGAPDAVLYAYDAQGHA